MKKTLLTVVLSCFLGAVVFAQQITGIVNDEQGKGLSGASVQLKSAADSALVKLAVTNAAGKYEFSGIGPGNYFVNISHISYAPQNSNAFEFNGSGAKQVPQQVLVKAAANLKEVVVNSKKPMVEVKADKTILNVEGTINAVGQDALELLRKSPGVLVDKDDNLSLAGKNGVQVYIDGRPSPLSGKDLADFLKTVQSSQVEAIEIITNPSAKYDAAGNAGIINIRLKKNKTFGTNGSVTAGYNIGILPKYNGGISLNHRNKDINVFGSYNINRTYNVSHMHLYRKQLDTLFDQRSDMSFNNLSHGFKAGLDYFVNKGNTLGVMVNGNIADNDFNNYSRTPITYIPTGVTDRVLVADNSSSSSRNNVNFNLNYRHTDTAGRELNMDADYGFFRIKSNQLQPNYYYNPSETNVIDTRIYNMLAPTDIDIYSFKTDYEQNFKKGKLGLGGKISYVESGNNFNRYDVVNNGKTLDTLRSNDFNYKENINALYVNYNRPFKGFMIQVGLRAENTNAEGTSHGFRWDNGYVPYDSTFKRNYTDLFPSAAITFNKNPMSQFSLTYSRRIDRPAYQDLNPFEFKLDEYTFQKGNTRLTPQYTNSFGLTHTYKYRLTTALNYSHVSDVFTQLIDTAEASKAFITKKNLAQQDIVSLNISYPFQYKKFGLFANLNSFYSHYKADFGGGNRTIDLDVFAFTFFAQSSLQFGKGWTAELSGWYSSPSIWQGTFKSKAMGSLDAGMQKVIFKGKGNLKASVSDVFRTMKWRGVSDFSGQYLRASGGWDSRQFKLALTWRFGSSQVKSARQRKTGLEDESKRVGSQGGGISQ